MIARTQSRYMKGEHRDIVLLRHLLKHCLLAIYPFSLAHSCSILDRMTILLSAISTADPLGLPYLNAIQYRSSDYSLEYCISNRPIQLGSLLFHL